ncbi:uridylate-specific endoribonuclease A-like [Saccoglossus kowalevskii]
MEDVKPDIMSFQFNWNNYLKEISSMWIGRSPEFEMAMYTICFKEFPNKACSFDMAGVKTKIQTYDQDGDYIGSAYPMT